MGLIGWNGSGRQVELAVTVEALSCIAITAHSPPPSSVRLFNDGPGLSSGSALVEWTYVSLWRALHSRFVGNRGTRTAVMRSSI